MGLVRRLASEKAKLNVTASITWDQVRVISAALGNHTQELFLSSPRELLDIFQAGEVGCYVITMTYDALKKLSLVNKDLDAYSLGAVKMFKEDIQKAGYQLS